jgi:hypothetical protein
MLGLMTEAPKAAAAAAAGMRPGQGQAQEGEWAHVQHVQLHGLLVC